MTLDVLAVVLTGASVLLGVWAIIERNRAVDQAHNERSRAADQAHNDAAHAELGRRIDATRTELRAGLDATRTELATRIDALAQAVMASRQAPGPDARPAARPEPPARDGGD